MSAERLREAAKVLRERAEAATPGRWGVGNGDTVATEVEQVSRSGFRFEHTIARLDDLDYDDDYAEPRSNDARPEDDALWIATMQPSVGLALADWLDAVAQRAEEVASTLAPNSQAREPIVNSLLAFREAVAVADAILGGAS
jgi:hypothetical protein